MRNFNTKFPSFTEISYFVIVASGGRDLARDANAVNAVKIA